MRDGGTKGTFGHIAMYNGTQWVSDDRQKDILPNATDADYVIYRDAP